jgi:protein SCO1/2
MIKNWLCALIAISALCGCNNQGWRLTSVAGHLPDLRFSLTDDTGRAADARDERGDIVLLYFGFAGCSLQCPVTMHRLADILKDMGGQADRVRVLFVSVDPAHDTPAKLHRYLAAFDTRHMVGLTGSPDAIERMARRYRAAYRPMDDGADRPHSDTVYIFDANGHARLLATPADSDAAIETDIKRLAGR